MEMANSELKLRQSNDHNILDISQTNFRNEDYILKLNTMQMLKFFKDELSIKYIGKGYNSIDFASVQANKPINKQNPIFYFEVEIVDEGCKKDITIGFSDKEFVLNKQCGTTSKSYGYNGDGKVYHEKTKGDAFGQKFKQKDLIGCGYYFSKNSIFYTINGKFIGWAFKNIDYHNYYATISLHSLNEQVVVNFGKKNFLFDLEGFYTSQLKEKINSISEQQIEIRDLEYVVREYLVHSGYQESFMALDKETSFENRRSHDQEGNSSVRKDSIDLLNSYNERQNTMEVVEDLPYDLDKLRKYSADDGMLKEPEMRKRTLSFMIDRMNDQSDKESDIFVIMNFLKERKIIHNMIMEKDYDTALTYFETNFQTHCLRNEINFKRIVLCLTTLKYFERLRNNDYMSAYQILNRLNSNYWSKDICVLLYNMEDKICDYTLENLSVLLCYQNLASSDLKHFLYDKQLSVICDQINSHILEIAGVSSESIIEKIIKQQTMVNYLYRTVKNCPGEKIIVKI